MTENDRLKKNHEIVKQRKQNEKPPSARNQPGGRQVAGCGAETPVTPRRRFDRPVSPWPDSADNWGFRQPSSPADWAFQRQACIAGRQRRDDSSCRHAPLPHWRNCNRKSEESSRHGPLSWSYQLEVDRTERAPVEATILVHGWSDPAAIPLHGDRKHRAERLHIDMPFELNRIRKLLVIENRYAAVSIS